MLHLMHAIDRATGYVFIPAAQSQAPPPDALPAAPETSQSDQPNPYALFSSAAAPLPGVRSDVRDVQERWIDAKEEWDAYEKTQWRKEGETIRQQQQQQQR
jgi:GPN-loop GTPase